MSSPHPTATPGAAPKAPVTSAPKFNTTPADTTNGSSSPYANNSLPNGQYDVYSVKDLYDKTLFTGTSTTNVLDDYGPGRARNHGQKVTTVQSQTVNDYLKQFAQMSLSSPKQFAQLQMQLFAGTAYGSSKPNWGVYTTADADAMAKAIRGYIGLVNPNDPNPLTISEYLNRLGAQGLANGLGVNGSAGGSTRAPLQLTSTATLQQVANSQGQQNLGRNLTGSEQGAFVDKYHGEEATDYNGGQHAGDPTAEAQSQIQKNNNAEYQVHLQAGYAAQMESLLGIRS